MSAIVPPFNRIPELPVVAITKLIERLNKLVDQLTNSIQKLISDAAKNIVDYRSWLSSAISEAERLHKAQNASLNAAEHAIAESRQKLRHAFDRLAQLQADINANLDSENNPTGKVFVAGAGKKAAAVAARKKQAVNKKSTAAKKKKK